MSTAMAEPLAITQPPVRSNQRFFTDHATSCPIRAELYGLDHLEALARELAAASAVEEGLAAGHPLLRRFMENGRALVRTHRRIIEAPRSCEPLPADPDALP